MKRLLALMLCAVSLGVGAQTAFNVDMTCAPEFDNVFVTGPWCGWCAENGNNVMTDPDGDGVYTVVIEDLVGTVEYKYAVDGFTGQENLVNDMIDGATCAPITDFNVYANRQTSSGSSTYDYYGTCSGTCNDIGPTVVTFRIDMSCYDGPYDPANVTWNSPFNGWCGGCAPMEPEGGDIYSLTVPLTGDTVLYKFAIGNWEDEEDLDPALTCTNAIYDDGAPNGCCYVNRFVVLGFEDAIDLPLTCWNSCEWTPTPGCTDPLACNYDSLAISDNASCIFVNAVCDDGNASTLNDIINDNCECEGELPSILEILQESSIHSQLLQVIQVNHFEDDLNQNAAFTLLAPTDEAFTNFLQFYQVTEDDLLQASNISSILFSHLIEGAYNFGQLLDFWQAPPIVTMEGEELPLDSLYFEFNENPFFEVDISAANGWVHFIDTVLWSPDSFEGCTIPIACNYDPFVTSDDNSCVFVCPGCTDPVACNFDADALQEDGTCVYPEDFGWCNCEGAVSDALGICGGTCDFDQDSDGVCDDVDDCIGIVDACGICNGPGAIYPCGCDDFPEGSCSCDGLTLVDQCGVCDGDGTSCVGCTYDFACNYDPEATIQDASQCEFGTCTGCLDPLACNYNPTVNGDDGSCEYPAFYLDCAGNCLNDANGNGVCDENEIFGCAYPSACNYDPQVTADDGSCDYSCVESFCEADFDFGNESWGFSPDPYNGESFEEGTVNLAYADVLHGLFPLSAGEIDPAYPLQLPIDSVLLLQGVQEDGLITNVLFTDLETNENFFSEDLGFVLTLNNPSGGVSPRTVFPEEQFCVSILGVPEREGNYRISFPFELWSTIVAPFSVPYVFEFPLSVITATIGCMDPNACNYQPTAVEDDGSCGVFDECGVCAGLGIPEGECDCDGNVVDAVGVCGGDCPSDFNVNGICDSDEVFGCTYDSAENYDPEATSDDGTCIGFEGGNVSSCLFDGDGNGGVGSGDLLGLLSEFGNVCE